MLQIIKKRLRELDESQLPDASTCESQWSREQRLLVESLSDCHIYLWYHDNPGKAVDKLLDRLSKYFNQDGGYIYRLPGVTGQSNDTIA